MRIPLKNAFTISSGSITPGNHVLVHIQDDEGNSGWGETTTWHKVYGYDQRSLCNVLNDYLIPAVTGLDAIGLSALHQCMEEAIPFNYMAKCGIDLAVLDLIGRVTNTPLHGLIGGKQTDRVALIGLIGITPPAQAAELAVNLVKRGFATLKVKIGVSADEDHARLTAIRAAVGAGVKLRVDANQGYDRNTAIGVLSKLEPLKLEWIEQPLPAWDLLGSAALAARLDTPIALDESIYTLHDVHRIIDMRAADVINIKLQKCGGIYPCQRIAAACESAGIPCFLGGCLELALGTAAMAHFYAATPNVVPAIETVPDYYVDDIAKTQLEIENRLLKLPNGPGLGIEVDRAKVEKFRCGEGRN